MIILILLYYLIKNNNMLYFIKYIINNFLEKCLINYYDYEIVSIKKISSSGSFIEYISDIE